jgi:hypothetical protein
MAPKIVLISRKLGTKTTRFFFALTFKTQYKLEETKFYVGTFNSKKEMDFFLEEEKEKEVKY